jgi:4a-hydroxytetrahydrobiopterin dehydratase
MREELSAKKCIPCSGDTPPLTEESVQRLQDELGHGWEVVDNHHLEKAYNFPDFRQALDFVNRVGGMAEEQGHHPDIYLTWGKVRITIWTHKIDGLTESDFIFAAKVEKLC